MLDDATDPTVFGLFSITMTFMARLQSFGSLYGNWTVSILTVGKGRKKVGTLFLKLHKNSEIQEIDMKK